MPGTRGEPDAPHAITDISPSPSASRSASAAVGDAHSERASGQPQPLRASARLNA